MCGKLDIWFFSAFEESKVPMDEKNSWCERVGWPESVETKI